MSRAALPAENARRSAARLLPLLLFAATLAGVPAFVPRTVPSPSRTPAALSALRKRQSGEPRRSRVDPLASTKNDSVPAVERTAAEDRRPSGTTDALPSSAASVQSSSFFPEWFEPLAWRAVILVLCALWASNFAAAKLVMAEPGVDSTLYAVARFAVAATALAVPSLLSLLSGNGRSPDACENEPLRDPSVADAPSAAPVLLDWKTVTTAAACGTWVAFGYLGQTFGLLTTTASRSCVICSLHCVFVAALAEYWRVQRAVDDTVFDTKRLVPAALAVAGVAIVELKGAAGAPTIGDALSFAQPVGFGMGYLLLEEIMDSNPRAALPVSAVKLLVVALSSLLTFELGPVILDPTSYASVHDLLANLSNLVFRIPDFTPILNSPLALGGILYTGLVTTALALWVESIAFAKVPATDASIILTTEPLIAALVGALTLGETFGVSDYLGATLIIGACAYAVLMDNPTDGKTDKQVVETSQ